MASFIINGKALTVTSSVKFEDLKKVAKYRPDALTLRSDDEKKTPIFKIVVSGDPMGKIDRNGAVFGSATASGLAVITVADPDMPADSKKYVAEKIGVGALRLNKLEETLGAVIAEIDTECAAVEAAITVVG